MPTKMAILMQMVSGRPKTALTHSPTTHISGLISMKMDLVITGLTIHGAIAAPHGLVNTTLMQKVKTPAQHKQVPPSKLAWSAAQMRMVMAGTT